MEPNTELISDLAEPFVSESGFAQFPAWLWPNLLSLDAPLVAVLWQLLFARCFRVSLGLPAVLVLVSTVWLIYSADRVFDAWRGAANAPRHQFYKQHWRSLAPVWIAVIVTTAWLACRALSSSDFDRGVVLIACVGVYFVLVHVSGVERPKEMAVGTIFALGASLVAWSKVRTPADAAAIVLFAVLCWINCAAIESWEGKLPGTRVQNKRAPVCFAAICVGFLALLLFFIHRPVLGGAEAASAGAFLVLWSARGKLSRNAMRVLADAALLSPVLFLPLAGNV